MHAKLGNYILGPTIGEGAFGKVKVALREGKDKYYAIKIIKKDNKNFKPELVLQEARILHHLELENTPAFFKYYESIAYTKKNGQKYDVVAIVMEYLPNGTLSQYIQASETGFSEEIARTLFISMITTMEKVHAKNIVHRDLKIQNMLFDENFILKIADFGIAAQLRNEEGPLIFIGRWGTPKYMAPEIWSGFFYHGAPVDVFSCAVILFNLVTAHPPFQIADSGKDFFYSLITSADSTPFWEHFEKKLGKTFSYELKDLFIGMFNPDPAKRPTLPWIKNHSWCQVRALEPEVLKEALSPWREIVEIFQENETKRRKEKSAEKKATKMQEEHH